jgi:hypothetical protein
MTAFFDLFAQFADKYSELNPDYISGAVNISGESILIVFSLLLTVGQVYHGSSIIITYLTPFQVCFLIFFCYFDRFF